jgi:hypothetical protein
MLELAQAYLYRAVGPESLDKCILHVRRIISYIGILKTEEEVERVPMHAQVYWSHAISLLGEEARRLREAGTAAGGCWSDVLPGDESSLTVASDAQQIETEISVARRALVKLQSTYIAR